MRLLRWSMLALAGVGGGMMLGDMATGTRLGSRVGEPASYSHLSANPDALVPQGEDATPCTHCADSYGVAVRMRAHRDDRMGDEFRALGSVDADPPQRIEADDDYHYGGRFPDPEPRAITADNDATTSASDARIADEIALVPPEY